MSEFSATAEVSFHISGVKCSIYMVIIQHIYGCVGPMM